MFWCSDMVIHYLKTEERTRLMLDVDKDGETTSGDSIRLGQTFGITKPKTYTAPDLEFINRSETLGSHVSKPHARLSRLVAWGDGGLLGLPSDGP